MALYAADLESLAKPVSKPKKGKKQAIEADPIEPDVPASTPVKEKKPPTEKQLAARAKFAENRKKKLEEKAAELLRLQQEATDKQKEIEAKEAQIAEKKKARAEKRKAAKEMDKAVDQALDEPDEKKQRTEEVEKVKKVKTPRKKRDDSEPPAWLNKLVELAKIEESKVAAEKKPTKQIKEEAKVTANEQWKDGYTRDRINTEVDNHMSRMYSMIFTRK